METIQKPQFGGSNESELRQYLQYLDQVFVDKENASTEAHVQHASD
jgi:hypothetical protein